MLADSDAKGEAVKGNVLAPEDGDVVQVEQRRSHLGEFTLQGWANRRGGFVGHDCGETERNSWRTAWAEIGFVGGRHQKAVPAEAKTGAKKEAKM